MCWVVLEFMTGSAVAATVLLVAIAGLGVAGVAGLRAMGITRDHPWLRRMASRPWRDGRDVLNAAVRHLPEVFVVTPSGSVFAPDFVELQMNPGDLASLCEQMEFDVVGTSVTQVYEDQVAEHGARFAGSGQPEVYIVPDDSVPQGRYRLRRGLPVSARTTPAPRDLPDGSGRFDRQYAYVDQGFAATATDPHGAGFAPEWDYEPECDHDQPASGPGYAQPVSRGPSARTRYEVVPGATIMDGRATVMEQIRPKVPVLRLVTGLSVSETSLSGARAGRGPVELVLPDVPTVSREHARFTFSAGRWWVTNQGMNGLFVNGVPVAGKQALSDGDSIRWGTLAEAPQSRVEIG
jgi:FHA domain